MLFQLRREESEDRLKLRILRDRNFRSAFHIFPSSQRPTLVLGAEAAQAMFRTNKL